MSFVALSLLECAIRAETKSSCFMFKVKQQLIAIQLGLPDVFPLMKSLELSDTQFDSLFYLFIANIETMNVCPNLNLFLDEFYNKFLIIRTQVNDMFSNIKSNEITLLVIFLFCLKIVTSSNLLKV